MKANCLPMLEPRVCPGSAFRRAGLTHQCVLTQNKCGWQGLARMRRVWAEPRCRWALGTACCEQEAMM